MSTPSTPEIYNGNPVFDSGMTPFGFYDSDEQFKVDAPKAARFIAARLGYPILDVELSSGSMFTALEESVTTYGNTIYAWKVRDNYLSLEGGTKDIDANIMVVEPSLQRIVEIAKNYGTEAEVGGNITLQHGMLELKAGVQNYDLDLWAKNQGIEGGIEIRRIFYEAPPAILRYFDPYAGTGTGIQSLMDAFDFGSYSPGVNFLLMPISYDLLKVQAIEFNDQVRKSTYSFRLSNNQLELFPIPTLNGLLRIEYYKLSDKRKLNPQASIYGTTSTHKISISDWIVTEENQGIFNVDLSTLGITADAKDSVSIQCYLETTVGGQSGNYMFLPEELTINLDSTGLRVESATLKLNQSLDTGSLMVTFPTYRTSVDGTTRFSGYSSDFVVNIPEGQQTFTQKFIHTLNTREVSVQVYEDMNNGASSQMLPAEINIVNNYEIDITFAKSTTGHVVFVATAQESNLDSGVITNVSEVPYENPTYSKINSIGRQWVFRYALAICKEILAYVRGKYQTVPIPDSQATLNQQDLLADARSEKENLLKELNDMLNVASRQEQLKLKAEEANSLKTVLSAVPVGIFIG